MYKAATKPRVSAAQLNTSPLKCSLVNKEDHLMEKKSMAMVKGLIGGLLELSYMRCCAVFLLSTLRTANNSIKTSNILNRSLTTLS